MIVRESHVAAERCSLDLIGVQTRYPSEQDFGDYESKLTSDSLHT